MLNAIADGPAAVVSSVPAAPVKTRVVERVLDKGRRVEIADLVAHIRRVVRTPSCREQMLAILGIEAVSSGVVHAERVAITAESGEST